MNSVPSSSSLARSRLLRNHHQRIRLGEYLCFDRRWKHQNSEPHRLWVETELVDTLKPFRRQNLMREIGN